MEHDFKKLGLKAKYFPEYKNSPFLGLYLKKSEDVEDSMKYMKKYGFAFQMTMLQKRFEIYRNAWDFVQKGGIAIVDRSLTGDYTFAYMLKELGEEFFSNDEWKVYLHTLTTEVKNCPEPSFTIYLQVSCEQAFKRMKSRGNRSETESYTLEYFRNLDKAYRKTMLEVEQPVLYIDWDADTEVNPEGYLPESICHKFLDQVIKELFFTPKKT